MNVVLVGTERMIGLYEVGGALILDEIHEELDGVVLLRNGALWKEPHFQRPG